MTNEVQRLAPADLVINRLGARDIALALRMTPSAVYRWTYAAPRGSNGIVPAKHHRALIALAEEKAVPLTYEELALGGLSLQDLEKAAA